MWELSCLAVTTVRVIVPWATNFFLKKGVRRVAFNYVYICAPVYSCVLPIIRLILLVFGNRFGNLKIAEQGGVQWRPRIFGGSAFLCAKIPAAPAIVAFRSSE